MEEPHSILISSGCCGKAVPCSLWISRCLGWGVRSLPCPCHRPSSRVPMAGAGMQPFPCQSLVSCMQPQPPQRGLQLARYFREKSQKQFLGTLLCSLGCSPSLPVPKTMSPLPCLPPCLTAGIASRWLLSEVSQFFPFGPKMCCIPLAVKTWI